MKKTLTLILLIICLSEAHSQKMLMSWGQKDIEGWTKEKYDESQKLTFEQLLESNLTAKTWSDIFAIINASVNNYSSNQQYYNSLVEQITNSTETKLQGTSRLIIWERIISGDIIFEGKGVVIENDIYKVGGRANQILQTLTKKNFGYILKNSTEADLDELKNKWLEFFAGQTVQEFKEQTFENCKINTICSLNAFHALIVSLKENERKTEITKNCLKNIYKLDKMPKDKSSPANYCNPDTYTFGYLGMLIGEKKNDPKKDANWWQNFWNENHTKLVWNDKKGHYEVK